MSNRADAPFVKIYVPISERPGDVVADHGKRWLVLIGEDSDSEEVLQFLREMMPDVEPNADCHIAQADQAAATSVRSASWPAARTTGLRRSRINLRSFART